MVSFKPEWTEGRPSLGSPRAGSRSQQIRGVVHLVSGWNPAANAWSSLPDSPTPRSGGGGAVLGGALYVLGGRLPGSAVDEAVHRFRPQAGARRGSPDRPIELTGHRAVAVGHDLDVVGGFATRDGQRLGFGGVKYFWRYSPP